MEANGKDHDDGNDLGWQTATMKKNDPWVPQNSTSTVIPTITCAPADPLRTIISSESYVKSLERRLDKLKGKTDKVRPKDMIQSLQMARDLHVSQFMTSGTSDIQYEENLFDHSETVITSIQKRLHPERQALYPLELVPLVKEDILSITVEESSVDESEAKEEKSKEDSIEPKETS